MISISLKLMKHSPVKLLIQLRNWEFPKIKLTQEEVLLPLVIHLVALVQDKLALYTVNLKELVRDSESSLCVLVLVWELLESSKENENDLNCPISLKNF